VLTGLIGGLLAQAQRRHAPDLGAVLAGTWWHAQAGLFGAEQNTILGVDAFSLSQVLLPTLKHLLAQEV
jgi:ADP-dependent NAD(P)H-hydrate dehydratase / NAD(P)H-hydrate epimerase